ncbi:MAG TPA: ABC transporter ATP-binding protein [Candidatus Limnocylindrales bacterium]|nr:ABC transporter ATP-binding protein [Candidatus Limnocylindrales bacterium]
MENEVLLEIRGLYKDFSGIKVIEGIDLSVKKGERHAIIGPNGAGKTTFFNLLTGRYKPSRGHIYFNGQEITGWPPHKINRMGISRSFQITNIFPGLTVFENVRAAVLSKNHIRFNLISRVDRMKNITEETYFILQKINLLDKKDQPAGELAYGEQRALEIGITLATDPALIMLDEPTAGMSIAETREVVKLIDQLTRGKTLMIIEHDMEVVFTLADVITVIHYGKVLATGKPGEIRGNPSVKDAYLGEHVN